MIDQISTSMDKKLRMQIDYNGQTRVIEVHTFGINTKGNSAIRAFQVRGGSNSNQPVGWKPILTDSITNFSILDESAETPRPGYKKGDKFFIKIVKEI